MRFIINVFAGYGVLALTDELFGRRVAAIAGISLIVLCVLISGACKLADDAIAAAMKEQKGRE